MLFDENIARLALDAERAKEGSALLWQEIKWASHKAPAVFRLDEDAETLPVNLSGRYQLGDGNEYGCEIESISPAGIKIVGPEIGSVGKWSTLEITSIGIVGGIVVRTYGGSFILGVVAPGRKLRRLAQRLQWRLQFAEGDVQDRRSSERVEMDHARATLETSDGKSYGCEIFDLSDGGAALHLGSEALYLWVDQPVSLNQRAGRVLRHFPGGVVVKFE